MKNKLSSKKMILKIVSVHFVLIFLTTTLSAQGDGPRAYLLAPKDITGISAKWLSLHQNIIPAGTGFVPGADIDVNVFPTALFHTFSIGGHQASILGLIVPGSVNAKAKFNQPPPAAFPLPNIEASASGLSDGMFEFKVGLHGTPALNAAQFAKAPMQYSLFGAVRYWYSGSYDETKLLNLGTGRGAFQFMTPMAFPLNKKRATATWLEVAPSLMLFMANNDPARGTGAQKITQAPLFILENHLSHNFNPKFWGVVNLRFQQGGETSKDDKEEGNNLSIIGTGGGLGYQILPVLGAYADYGFILSGDNGAESNMFRLSFTFAMPNMKKLKAESK